MRRFGFGAVVILTVVLGVVTASAAVLNVAPSVLATFTLPAAVVRSFVVPASVDIKPASLQKRSMGIPVTAFIELPTGFDAAGIVASTVRLCQGTSPCGDSGVPAFDPRGGDADHDGVSDLMLQFSRQGVIALVTGIPAPATVTFTVSGLVGSRTFAGSDTVRLVDPEASPSPEPSPSPSSEPPPEPSPSTEPEASPSAEPGTGLRVGTPSPTGTPAS